MANNINFVVKNGLTVNGSFTANSTAVNASAILATSVNTATANATTSIVVGANVTINTSTYFVGNTTVNTSIIGGQISLSGATVNSTIYQGTANNANNLGGVAAASYVNTSGAYTVTGIHTHQANILMGNTTVNTQISNATILISNSTSTTTLGLTDLRIGNTTTNVVISNTTSTFGGNLTATGSISGANVTTTTNAATIGTAAYFVANGNVGIGNTAPNAKLQVTGTANISGNVAIGDNLTATGSISGANVTTTTNAATIGTAAYFVANGNLGIGTSSPGSKLTVTSTTTGSYEIGRFQGAANSSPFLYHLTTGGSPSFSVLSYGPQPSAVYPTLTIRGFYSNATGGDAGGYPQLELVRSGGNTSITTATPSGAILSRIISYGSNSSSSLPGTLIESVAEADFTTTSTTGIRFQTTNAGSLAEAVRFAANGNVGIGNNTPNAKLVVTGTANVSGDVAIGGNVSISGVIKGQATALSGDVLLIGDNSKLVDINVIDTAGLYSQSNTLIGSLKLGSNGGIISGFNGKIGIANLAPDATLSITGTANVSGNVVIGGVATVTGNVTLGSSAFFVGNGVSITTVNATSVTTGTLPDARLSSAIVNTTAAFTITGVHTYSANLAMNSTAILTGNTSVVGMRLLNAAETVNVSATAATGTITYRVSDQAVLYYTSNATANWTPNVSFSSATTLNTAMSNGQSISIAFLVTQGATAYFSNTISIDGSAVTPKWQGGTTPTAGNASGIDSYLYNIIKTGTSTFTVLASLTQFK